MKHYLFIDPGLASDNGTGWTHFVEHYTGNPRDTASYLNTGGLVQGVESYPLPLKCRDIVGRVKRDSGLEAVDMLVIEHMRNYPIARMRGDGNQLIALAFLEGSFQMGISADVVKLVETAEWKGQVPEKIMRDRIKRSLIHYERETIETVIKAGKLNAKEAMNVWVAAGIGLHHFGRLR